MISKKFLFIGAIVVVFLIAAIVISKRKSPDDQLPVTLSAIQTPGGWGYQISVDGKVFIKQPYVPVVAGEESFKSKDEALTVGNLAVKKIVSGKTPVITKEELKALKILN